METLEFARQLRKNQTPEEVIVWNILRARRFHGFKFRRQVPIGRYFADFLCEAEKLIVEIDGDHHLEQMSKDDVRAAKLRSLGYSTIRVSNYEVKRDLDLVRAEIAAGLGIRGDQP